MKKNYRKLVRDNIPNIIKANGEVPVIRILNDSEYKFELERKLKEECQEVLEASGTDRIEELADMLEVIIYLAKIGNTTLEEVMVVANEKRLKKGAFDEKIFLEEVIEQNPE